MSSVADKKIDWLIRYKAMKWVQAIICELFPLTPRCPTLKVPDFCAFSRHLRATTFWRSKIYFKKRKCLGDFENFLFFHLMLFLCASLHTKNWAKNSWKTKCLKRYLGRSLAAFCVENTTILTISNMIFIIFL